MHIKFTENPFGKKLFDAFFLRQKIMVQISTRLRMKRLFSVN